ncbi:MAG: ATP-binding protein, partial [Nitrospinota bacterium]
QAQKMQAVGYLTGGVAHEFNNLLTGILGQAELLELKEADPDKKKRLQSIGTAATDAAELISRYREKFQRTLSGERQDVVDLEQVVRDVVDLQGQRTAGSAQERDIAVEVQPGGPWLALGNASEFKEVITNLLLNALSATAEKGDVSVSVGTDGDHVCVRVKDTGHGISPQALPRIFDPFFTTKKDQGTGIGLTISRTILKNHGGDLRVSSKLGEGSLFVALLPRWRGEILKGGSPAEKTSVGRKVKALLVEDNAQTSETIREMLLSLGIEADCVDDASGAEDALRAEVYDLVVTDFHLKESTGLDVLRAVKNRGIPTPVLLITGNRDGLRKEDAERFGSDGLLLKPFTIRQLGSAINKLMEASAADNPLVRPGARIGGPAPVPQRGPSAE